jgi:hypothetical protein
MKNEKLTPLRVYIFLWFCATFKIGQEENHVGRGMLKSHETYNPRLLVFSLGV